MHKIIRWRFSATIVVTVIALKIAGFSISFFPLFKVSFHSFRPLYYSAVAFCFLKGRYNMITSRETSRVMMRRP